MCMGLKLLTLKCLLGERAVALCVFPELLWTPVSECILLLSA